MKLFLRLSALTLLVMSALCTAQQADELEYPKVVQLNGNVLQIHHPVIDRWDRFRTVEGWIPIEVQLAGSNTRYVGAVRARARSQVDLARRIVRLSDQEVLEVRFSNTAVPEAAREMAGHAVGKQPHNVVLDALLHALASDFEVPRQSPTPGMLNEQPPRIVVSEEPAQLLLIDKQPVAAPITGTGLEFVVNTDWKLFHQPVTGNWYVLNRGAWQTHSMLATGGWNTTTELPDDFRLLALGDEWQEIREAYPARMPEQQPPPFIVSLEPTELVIIDGPARLAPAGDEGLSYVTNTDRDLFQLDRRWYLLLAGRWFVADALAGDWAAVRDLPAAFGSLPESHPRTRVRAAIPGTVESVVSMMEAVLPRRRSVTAEEGAALSVAYAGTPRFESIEGTTLERAVNSPSYVFQHNNFYYLCHDAAWFLSRQPAGPWSPAHAVPDEIYRIPASDPAYFVTFVRPVAAQDDHPGGAWFEHNSGYLGEFSTGVSVVQGTGWYYSPWLWYDPVGRPVYWSHPYTYGWRMNGYGPHGNRFYYHGGWGPQQRITLDSEPVGVGGNAYDPAFQDPRLARPGYDYSTIDEQRRQAQGAALNADDDYYTDRAGNVYRQDQGQWSQHTGDGWSTMADLERQYGSGRRSVGEVAAPPPQRQAYKQNPNDIERMKRYHESRKRSYNMYGYVTVSH